MKTTTGILPWVTLALLGITSAILCIAQPSFHGWVGILYVGTVYGVLLGVYFVVCRGIRSAVRLISLVVVSAIAWPIAYFGSFWGAPKIPAATVHIGDAIEPQFPLIAFGGVLGGVALLMPVVLIFKPSSSGTHRPLACQNNSTVGVQPERRVLGARFPEPDKPGAGF